MSDDDLNSAFTDPELLRVRRVCNALGLRAYQRESIEFMDAGWREQDVKAQLLCMGTGLGKCLGFDTPVLMHDGRIIKVQDVKHGDSLMGADSKARRVLGICRGREMLYRVTPTKGESYVVNESHILSLKITNLSMRHDGKPKRVTCAGRAYNAGEIANVGVRGWIESSKIFKHVAKGWRTGVSFSSKSVELDPYMLGIWLGDGETGGTRFATMDKEIVDALRNYAATIPGHVVNIYSQPGKCPIVRVTRIGGTKGRPCELRRALQSIGVIRHKHVPFSYKTNSEANRLNLLAGLIDTDGSLFGGCYDFISSLEELASDVAYLARSLGFAAYKTTTQKTCGQNGKVGTYYRVCISGNISRIPCRIARKQAEPRRQIKDVLVTGIKVEPIGVGDYYGFEIDGDHLFLLGDFTVTHNTPTMAALARIELERSTPEKITRVLVLAHTDELIEQALDKITRFGQLKANKEKADAYAGRYARCVVGSVQTMSGNVRLSMWPANHFTLVLVDEAHRSLAASYQKILTKFQSGGARIVGVTATADRGDKRSLGEFYQKIAFDYGLLQGVRDGWLIRPLVRTMPLELDLRGVKSKHTAAGNDLDQTEVAQRLIPFLGAIAKQVKETVPGGTFMFFMPSVETARLMSDALNAIGMASEWISGDRENRKQIVADFKKGTYRAICNMAVLTEGFDHDKVDTIVCLRPTKIRSLFVQIVGRASRPVNEIVPLLGKAKDAFDRRSIIKASIKPAYQILDFLWLYEKHDLVCPASLVTEKEEVKKAMKKDGDLIENEQQAERDVLAALEKAVRKNENKKSRVIDPLEIAAELGDVNLANYEAETANDALEATALQLKQLDSNGVDISKIKNRGHASALLMKVIHRQMDGLATIRQMHFIWENMGIDASLMKRVDADNLMQKQREKWNAMRGPKVADKTQMVMEDIGL